MLRKTARFLLLLLCALALTLTLVAKDKDKKDKDRDRDDRNGGNVVIAQISDIHMGLAKAPDAAQNLQRALEMIGDRHVDAIVVSGDIGERPPEREKAKQMIDSAAHGVPVYYVAGNHDDSAHDTGSFTSIFGRDYYDAHVRFVHLVVLDSQLLGNYDDFGAMSPQAFSGDAEQKAQSQLGWLRDEFGGRGDEARGGGDRDDRGDRGGVTIAVQHVPLDRGSGFPQERDPKPYWTTQEPYRSHEADLLHRMGVRDILAGHLHHAAIYKADGFTLRLAPAIGYPIGGGDVGFAIHTIKPNGDIDTQFVDLH